MSPQTTIASVVAILAIASSGTGAAATAPAPAPADDIVVVPWPVTTEMSLNVSMGYGTVPSTGTRFSWYSATLNDLSRFTVQLPLNGGCSTRAGTTQTAAEHDCEIAVNAGYFQFVPKPTYCLGQIVVDSAIQEWAPDGNPMFGILGNRSSFVGTLTSQDDISRLNVTYAVSGFGVLVRDGEIHHEGVRAAAAAVRRHKHFAKSVATTVDAASPQSLSSSVKAEEIAPRTVIGLDNYGQLVLVAIDGVEALDLGLTLAESAEIFSSSTPGFPFGGNVAHAINMDGGGSTTFTKTLPEGTTPHLYNRPTSTDIGDVVERNVTTIACIARQSFGQA